MSNLIEQHKAYMVRDKSKDKPFDSSQCLCDECGCIGNTKCGHEPLGDACALDDVMICPCCNKVFDKQIKERRAGK